MLYGARGLRDVARTVDEYRAMIHLHVMMLCGGAISSRG
jgi:hypothetical protein